MTMPDERRKSIIRTHDFLREILSHKYENGENYHDLWYEARSCLKHYPSEFYMDEARELAPEVFGDWQQDEKLNRIEIIGDDGREVVKYAPEGCYYRRSVQDNGRTVKFFLEKKNGNL